MLAKRIIPCLDVNNGRVVKGINFVELRDAGDPVELARYYYEQGADELCFLDITATIETRAPTYEMIRKVAREIFIPFSVGGGVKSVADAEQILKCGAEKVVVGSAAVKEPKLITELAKKFGSQAVCISIDAKRTDNGWNQFINGGRIDGGIDAIGFAKKMECFGAGEILLNSIDKDGTKQGFDIELCDAICKAVNIPVIASSGAKNIDSFVEVFKKTEVNAALAASIFHFGEVKIKDLKKKMKKKGVEIRD